MRGATRLLAMVLSVGATATIAVIEGADSGMLVSAGQAEPPGSEGAERIEFAPGTDSATVEGTFTEGQTDAYVLWAMAGQTMTIHFEPAGASIGVFAPDGSQLPGQPGVDFSAVLSTTGDYVIVVGGGRSDVAPNYTFTVRIPASSGTPQRIQFAPGTDYGSVAGTLQTGSTDRYVLQAAAGQTMTVVAASVEQNAVVTVLAPDGTLMQPANVPVFVGDLPMTGDYVIEVSAATGGASTYGLGVHIPGAAPAPTTSQVQPPVGTSERIEFAPGTNTASVNGAVVLGTTNEYILGAAAGQTMVVQVDSVEDNAVFTVHAPDGTALTVEQQQATFQVPADGDYVVAVGSTRGNATYQISFWIE
jgi:hypothetical protein